MVTMELRASGIRRHRQGHGKEERAAHVLPPEDADPEEHGAENQNDHREPPTKLVQAPLEGRFCSAADWRRPAILPTSVSMPVPVTR